MHRAKAIDWLAHIVAVHRIENRGVFFMTINIMDRYYANPHTTYHLSEIQLTLVTALMLATKYFEVHAIEIKDCQTLCNDVFTKDQFLKREFAILTAIGCDLDVPHQLEYICYYNRVLKLRMQNENLNSDGIIRYLSDSEILAYDFCKAIICDEYFLNEKLSLVTASSMILSFTLVE